MADLVSRGTFFALGIALVSCREEGAKGEVEDVAKLERIISDASTTGRPCTLLRCDDELRVQVVPGEATGLQPKSVEARFGSEVRLCHIGGFAGEERCEEIDVEGRAGWQLRVSSLPSEVEVRVRTARGTSLAGSYVPKHEHFRPNGEGCPPTCRLAVVKADLAVMRPLELP